MSARALPAGCFERAAKQADACGPQAPASLAVEIQFQQDLWREHRLEAINAGLNTIQATAYADALSAEVSLAAGALGMAPFGRSWFYQSRARLVQRTFTSGLIRSKPKAISDVAGRTGRADAFILARKFRWWNVGRKS